MKKRILPVLFLASWMLAFTSCQKESISTDIPSREQSPEDYLNSLGQPVFFQFDYQNEATGEFHGWFVDNEGAVKTYELQSADEASDLRRNGPWTPDQLRRLYNLTRENRHRLTPRELAQMVRRIRAASQGRLSDRVVNRDRTEQRTYRAFWLERRQIQNLDQGSCNNSSSPSTTTVEEIKVVTLKTTGAFDQENLSDDAKALTRWLDGVATTAGL